MAPLSDEYTKSSDGSLGKSKTDDYFDPFFVDKKTVLGTNEQPCIQLRAL